MGSRNKGYDYDLIVIGSGSGGNVAASIVAKTGKRVAIADEAPKLGGECPNWACVPTKALLRAGEFLEMAHEAPKYGIKTGKVSVDWKKVKAYKDLVVSRTGTSSAESFFKSQNIDVLHGHAHFLDKHTVTIKRKRYTARKFLIASGTKSFIPPIKGIEEVGYITYEQALDVAKPPKSLAVIGGGAIGCEFAQIFNTFGSKVIQFEAFDRLLGREEPEVAELTKAIFTKKGIAVKTGTIVHSVEKKGAKKVLHFGDGTHKGTVSVDEVLIATGKVPNVDLGLENAGVKYTRHGIETNLTMQTSQTNIFAAGDVVGPYAFTHTAAYQSRLAGHNMFARKENRSRADYHNIPRCVFVSPEVASVGITEQEVRDHGIKPKIGLSAVNTIGRSNTENAKTGLIKIVCNQKGTILGASIVAPRAGEMIHELAVAIKYRAHAHDIADMIHAFPTWSEAVKLACAKVK